MTKIILTLQKRPLLYSLIFTLLTGLFNFLTYILFRETNIFSFNLVLNMLFYGTIQLPLYYVLIFAYFFLCIQHTNSKARPYVIGLVILYIIMTLPIIDLDVLFRAYKNC